MALDPLTLLGGALGAVARLLPEFGRLWDAANQRKHEREMLKLQTEADKLRAELAMQSMEKQGEINIRIAELNAMVEALRGQMTQSTATGNRFIDWLNGFADGLSKLVRPTLTYWYCVVAYGAYKVASYFMILSTGTTWENAITVLWTPADQAVMWSILAFWFVDRSLRNRSV